MIPELGHLALVIALMLALAQAFFGIAGATTGRSDWMHAVRPLAALQFLFVAVAFGMLAHAFLVDNFSVLYVSENSNTALPWAYKFAAVWGAHEGSLLLWATVLGGWTLAAAALSRSLPIRFVARAIGILGLVAIGFYVFMILTSNPFERLVPAPMEGRDLNPLLQDPGMVMHPPMLYMGYVGFAVPFAFAVAALLGLEQGNYWARWTRPWATTAWLFLTIGIALGSWWAYYELGWGGWWFWDPVENASFMPWLAGTALIHSLAVTEKRGAFRGWTVLLAITTFSLSLLGTFLVRSGVLVSVHAFATDPARGVFILAFLAAVVGGSLALFAWAGPRMRSTGGFTWFSRETLLLMNNLILVVACAAVLLGTLYPLVLDALGVGKISVGPPYFNAVFVPVMLPLILLMGLGPYTRWKRDRPSRVLRGLWPVAVAAVVAAFTVLLAVTGVSGVAVAAGLATGLWVLFGTLVEPWRRVRQAGGLGGLRRMPRSTVGMLVAHAGLALSVLGVTVTAAFSIEKDVRMEVGEATEVGGYEVRFDGTRPIEGPNYTGTEGRFTIRPPDGESFTLTPQKRVYRVQRSPMTEAGIDAGLWRDIFVALGDPLGKSAWSVRAQYKPMIRFIWLGAIVMALGGLLAASDRRYRRERRAETVATRSAREGEVVP